MTSFDVVVVGAGPAGSAAALELARAGRRVAVLERGPFPGSKNMYGGVVYGRVLDALVPDWWDEVPKQRWITRRQTMTIDGDRAMTVDYRTGAWGRPPYNGCTTFRPDFDAWLAAKAEDAGATVVCSTTVTGLRRDAGGRTVGVQTDRGDVEAPVVIACDGVNSFLAKEAGLHPHGEDPRHLTLGVKEVLGLPRHVLEDRFNIRGDDGVDIEILGCTGEVAGGGFVYTNAESVSIGVVLQLAGLRASGRRPESFVADLKAHPALAPLVDGGELLEYSAHLIPEGGYDMMPTLAADGLLVAGDAAAMCLAAGIWLEGVNFAIGAGAAAGQTAHEALAAGDTTASGGLAGYQRRLEASFVLQDHKKLRRAPNFVLSDRVQNHYPQLVCDLVEELFTVRNPRHKLGGIASARAALRRSDLRIRDLARDAWTALRTFG